MTNPPVRPTPSTSGHTSWLVLNPLTGSHTLVGLRAHDTHDQFDAPCPLCADRKTMPDIAAPWLRPDPFCALDPATGITALLAYTPTHGRRFASLAPGEAEAVIAGWQRAYRTLASRYACVLLSETHGVELRQPFDHLHGHLAALNTIPHPLATMRAAHLRATATGDPCPTCAELRAEADGPRRVLASRHWIGFVPPYARYPYQVHIAPRAHAADLDALAREQLDDLATALLRLVRAYDHLYEAPMPYMLGVHQLREPSFHLRVEVLPVGRSPGKLKLAASGEMGWGLWVNDAAPEAKAADLRAALTSLASDAQ